MLRLPLTYTEVFQRRIPDQMPTHVLGIDVGTSGTRAVIVDGTGRIVASATEEHAPFASPRIGWAEQSPEDWWRACGVAVRKALAGAALRPIRSPAPDFLGRCTEQ